MAFEPKFDGWRSILFAARGVIQSKQGNEISHRFPEIVAAASGLGEVVLDGEMVALREGRLDFGALQSVPRRRAAAGITIYYVAFDLLAIGELDVRAEPWWRRRERLEQLLTGVGPPLQLCPSTTDRASALHWMDPAMATRGIEGVVAKNRDKPYRAGRSGFWLKTRQKIVVDCHVLGVTATLQRPNALVLGQADDAGELRPVGVSLPIPHSVRAALVPLLQPLGPRARTHVGGLPGQPSTEYQPVKPGIQVEVEADPLGDETRFRHRPRVHRIRDG
jgi:ATP-dependent DNA ligase